MRRNMQEVLTRWGRWAAVEENCTAVDWPRESVLPQRAPETTGGAPGCCDDDGILIDSCIARLRIMRREDDMLILGLRYICGLPLRPLAEAMGLTVSAVRASLDGSEAFIEGSLAALDVSLRMDPAVIYTQGVACAPD